MNKRVSKGYRNLLDQYNELRKQNPEAILLFRQGDFYEAYGECAEKLAEASKLMLTTRQDFATGEELKMAGFPHSVLEDVLKELIAKGHRVAIAEQAPEAPKNRKIERIITPGSLVE